MTDRFEEFVAGERPDDVAIYLADEAVDDPERLAEYGERVAGGTRIVVDGERGRSAFEAATGDDPMGFAGAATQYESTVSRDLTDGDCPDDDGDGEHVVRIAFAFAEAHKPDMDDIYGEGDVLHAYVQCSCGAHYSEKWVADEK